MERMNTVLMLAGGVGTRMGANIPKQFIKIKGKPIIAYTLDILENNENIDAVEIVCVHGFEDLLESIIDEYGFKKVKWICEGGSTFSLSVYNGLKNLRDKLSPDDLLMIHMSVAPFIGDDILNDAIRVAQEKGNSISENPCYLCMGSHDTDEYSTKSVLRETITGLNTPQTFHFGELIGLYDRAKEEGILEDLEPHTTSVYYHYEKPLYFSKGSQLNIKITNQDDLDLFEAFCIMKEQKRK
jgi:2-C-methyl-D-erythritol 4-phosphate cytidylyltransferase